MTTCLMYRKTNANAANLVGHEAARLASRRAEWEALETGMLPIGPDATVSLGNSV